MNTKRATGIDQTYTVMKGSSTFVVDNERNKIRDTKPTFPKSLGNGNMPWVIMSRTTKLDNAKLLTNIASAFSLQQLVDLKNEKLILLLYFSDSGDLLEITFGLYPESKLTAKDINAIENRLKKNLKLEILTDDMKGSSFLQYDKMVYFRDLQETR